MPQQNSAHGLRAIYNACLEFYPDQPNPLQVAALKKFKHGGPDPLDFINMYRSSGSDEEAASTSVATSPTHWHYVTFGLSNLYGDSVFGVDIPLNSQGPSGFGFELTFRLKRAADDGNPPMWPAQLLQDLARYVFRSQAQLLVGDNIPWNGPLDQTNQSNAGKGSKIRNMLLVEDPQLRSIQTPFGFVQFLQVVGITKSELKMVQSCASDEVLGMMTQMPATGGPLLVTDMNRRKSLMHLLSKELQANLQQRITSSGSNLSGVLTEFFAWRSITQAELDRPVPGEVAANVKRKLLHDSQSTTEVKRDPSGDSDADSSQASNERPVPRGSRGNAPSEEYVDVVGEVDSTSDAEARCTQLTDISSPNADVEEMDTSQPRETVDSAAKWTAFRSAQPDQTNSGSTSENVTPVGLGVSPVPRSGTREAGQGSSGSTPCTPLNHLTLSPTALSVLPTRLVEPCLDIQLSWEAGQMLPLAIRDRLKHGSHFTFLNALNPEPAITLVSTRTEGAFVNENQPYAAKGSWLQVFLPNDFLEQLEYQFDCIKFTDEQRTHLPIVMRWPERNLRISLTHPPGATDSQPALEGCFNAPPFKKPMIGNAAMDIFQGVNRQVSPVFPLLSAIPPPNFLIKFLQHQQQKRGQQ